jgi:catalase
MDDGQRDRLVSNVVGHLRKEVSEPVPERAFEYWRKIDRETGDRIAKGAYFTATVTVKAPRGNPRVFR